MAIWPCKPRDFVTHIQRAKLDDGSVAIVNSATTHPEVRVREREMEGGEEAFPPRGRGSWRLDCCVLSQQDRRYFL